LSQAERKKGICIRLRRTLLCALAHSAFPAKWDIFDTVSLFAHKGLGRHRRERTPVLCAAAEEVRRRRSTFAPAAGREQMAGAE
jgi:hypothetical protein